VREVARFLVGIDFSAGSRRALAEARALARRSGAALTLAHVRPFSDIRAAVVEERGELVRAGGRSLSREIAAHYARRLAAWAREADGDRTLLLRGAPDLALSREARRGYALLVVGGCGHNAVSSVFLGSTAQRVLARSTIPVLVVPGRRRA
jgi:nucleotide-binding universal stress UspA family protein